jgi:histidinol-phosphatase (PHP family)
VTVRDAGGDPGTPPDPQGRDLPLDAHLHTQLSHDSEVPVDVYAAAAVARGIPEIAITDHLDFEPSWRGSSAPFDERERYVREAAERWADRGLAIRFGAEITYDRRFEDEIRAHLASCSYDYTIGSVHVSDISPYHPVRVAAWVDGRELPEILEPHLRNLTDAIRSGLFDTIGHLDYVKRWLHPLVSPERIAAAPELLEPILRLLVEEGTTLEVNTSGLRQSPRETYPAPWAVARFRELGGRRVVVGSDGHRPEWFAWGLADGYAAVRGAGFRALAFRRGGGSVDIPLGDERWRPAART